MTQPVGKAPDGSLWTYPSTESGTVPWGNIMGDITKQQDLIQKFNAKSDVGHEHDISTLTFTAGDIAGSWIADNSISETAYGSQSVPTRAIKDLSVTSEKLSNGAVTTSKLANGAVTNEKTNFSAGFAPTGPIILKEGVHYGNTTPATGVEGQLFFTPVDAE